MLDYRVETFLCVCRNMSYTKAAGELSITQPAVTGHIRYIEDYYRVRLFEYRNKRLTLTEEGMKLRQALEVMSTDIRHIRERLSGADGKKVVNIGATRSIGDFILADRLPEFIVAHPELNVNVCVEDTKHLFQRLHEGRIDFFLCEGIIDKQAYDHSFIVNEPMRAVCSSEYVLPEIRGIESLFNERLLLREPGSGTRNILVQALSERGYRLSAFHEICTFNSPAMILELAEKSCGITFIFDSVCHEALKRHRLREIEIPGFTLSHEFNAVWEKGSIFKEETRRCVDELRALCAGQPLSAL